MKSALILGVGGQDGSYLAEILLQRGYTVHGLYRRSSVDNLHRIRHLRSRLTLHRGDLADPLSLHRAVRDAQPDEVYHVADQDDANWSRVIPDYTLDVSAGGTLRLLEILRETRPSARLFVPVTALLFGAAPPPQRESTPFNPLTPYACAKAAVWYLCRMYRQCYGMFVSCGIMFNHDSPARSEDYVLHKICKAAVRIAAGKQDQLTLGCLDMRFDVGFARDYMEAAWQMLQLEQPDDFVIGTGEAWSIRQMVVAAFLEVGIIDWEKYVALDPSFQRPGPQPTLVADPAKAREVFGFNPSTSLQGLIRMIVEHEREVLAR